MSSTVLSTSTSCDIYAYFDILIRKINANYHSHKHQSIDGCHLINCMEDKGHILDVHNKINMSAFARYYLPPSPNVEFYTFLNVLLRDIIRHTSLTTRVSEREPPKSASGSRSRLGSHNPHDIRI